MPTRPLIRLHDLDVGPDDVAAQLPKDLELARPIPGPDRPDYALAIARESPLRHETTLTLLRDAGVDPAAADPDLIRFHPDGEHVLLFAFGLVLAPRVVGDRIHLGMRGMPVSVALVVDNTLMRDERLDFAKCLYVAVAEVTALPAEGEQSAR